MKNLFAVAAAFAGCGVIAASGLQAAEMPVAQQNAMVQKYCATCHTDAVRNGGLSLQHFDAAHADPGEVAMMVGKLKTGALGASGLKLPDQATQDAFQSALTAESAGADKWTVTKQAGTLIASAVRSVQVAAEPDIPNLYRLKLTCDADTHKGELQVAWSPRGSKKGQIVAAALDGREPMSYPLDEVETYGNGMPGSAGHAAVVLQTAQMPAKTLTVSSLYPDEKVVFPVGELDGKVRRELARCFAAGGPSH